MLTFVCWKWKRPSTGFKLPSNVIYSAKHVNNLKNMLSRHYKLPHKLICFTDDASGIECETLPIPTKYAELGGCYRRLWMFSPEAKTVLGDKIVSIDLDCVIVNNCTDLFTRNVNFMANTYHPTSPDQYYNGGLMMHKTGTLPQLWNNFSEKQIPSLERFTSAKKAIGTDQAWIRYMLNKYFPRWNNTDGVYEARQIHGENVPKNAKIILFAGKIDPSEDKRLWVTKNWL